MLRRSSVTKAFYWLLQWAAPMCCPLHAVSVIARGAPVMRLQLQQNQYREVGIPPAFPYGNCARRRGGDTMTTTWKSSDKDSAKQTTTNNTLSGTILSSWSRQ